jgi:hypothetical protein
VTYFVLVFTVYVMCLGMTLWSGTYYSHWMDKESKDQERGKKQVTWSYLPNKQHSLALNQDLWYQRTWF